MKRLLISLTLIPLGLTLAACDNTAPPPPPKTDATAQGSDRLYDSQRQALEKARAVEGQVNAAAEAQRKQMEQAAQP